MCVCVCVCVTVKYFKKESHLLKEQLTTWSSMRSKKPNLRKQNKNKNCTEMKTLHILINIKFFIIFVKININFCIRVFR